VDLRVREDTSHSLQVSEEQVALGQLPREVREGGGGLCVYRGAHASPPSIVIVFLVDAIDEVFSISPLELSIFLRELIDESFHELCEKFLILVAHNPLIELPHDVGANHSDLNVLLHVLQVVMRELFGELSHLHFFIHNISQVEGIPHSALSKRLGSHLHSSPHLALLDQRLRPVDNAALLDPVGVADDLVRRKVFLALF